MGLNAAVQALKKAEPLKDKVQRCKDLLNDNDAWVCQQQLQKIYQQVLILDLEYALDRKVEQELWNLGFKNYIATLQLQAKDRKNPKRGESQALLGWCLEAASGFYLTLLQEICTAFDLDLPFRRKGYVYGCTSPWKAVEKLSVPHKSSCFYACQYCLVHLGDIARYRNESKQAELFYRHAVSLSPSSGQPYNQLALLEASRGNKLGTVFHYARSVAVKHPFPVATTNLAKTLSSALNENTFNIERRSKLTSQEYIAVFLKLHGVIHNYGDLKLASSYVKLLTETLTALVVTQSFSSWMLVQMLVINLYALEYTASVTVDNNTETLRNEQLAPDEKLARECILDLIAGSLSALLLPIYTIKNSIMEYFALPSIKLCLDWIHAKPTVLEEVAFTSRLQIWPSLCVLLNALQISVVDFAYEHYVKVPLPEDRDLQGFIPLEKSFEGLKFTSTDLEGEVETLNKLRAVRILRLGRDIAQYRINGSPVIVFTAGAQPGYDKFTSVTEGTGLSNELIKELEELSLNKEKQPIPSTSPVLSESASSKGSTDIDLLENTLDKRVGILKPQSSSERSREIVVNNIENSADTHPPATNRKPRQNVAMQAIMRRAETEQKQVTFKNISPVIMEEESEKKRKAASTSPAKVLGNKSTPMATNVEPTVAANIPNSTSALITLHNRPPLMPFAVSTHQSQTSSTQAKPPKLQHSIASPPIQVTQTSVKEQQLSGVLPQMSVMPQGINPVCYPNQPFTVQNPQFAKNLISNHIANMSNYQMQGQVPNPAQNVPPSMNLQHSLNQARPLHQRLAHNVPQSPMLHQNIGLPSPVQQNLINNVSQSVSPQQTVGVGLQQSISMQQQQQNHNLILQQQQNVAKAGLRPTAVSNSHSQVGLAAPGHGGISALPALNTYQKNLHQNAMIPNITNVQTSTSISPTSVANYQVNYNQSNFSHNAFGQMPPKQLPSTPYNKNSDMLEFPFPNQGGMPKSNTQPNSNYSMFHNYEGSDFNLWKSSQQPQNPMAGWGSPAVTGSQMRGNDTAMENYQNWEDAPKTTNAIGGRNSLTVTNKYQLDHPYPRHFGNTNSFEETRQIDVDLKSPQPISTGNTYSLFSGNTWGSTLQASGAPNQDQVKTRLNQQSLWSGPGPSPLERLLEQQKSLREGGT